jgi:uncharacterized protein (DUF1786 family)
MVMRVRGRTNSRSALSDPDSVSGNKNNGNNKVPTFTVEHGNMHFTYGFCDGNYLAALRDYQHRYLDRRQPYRRVPEMVYRNLSMTHTFADRGHSVWDEEDVLVITHNNLQTSIRHIPSATGRLS